MKTRKFNPIQNEELFELAAKDAEIARLKDRVEALRGALAKIERSYALHGERMAHQDYALKVLAADDQAGGG